MPPLFEITRCSESLSGLHLRCSGLSIAPEPCGSALRYPLCLVVLLSTYLRLFPRRRAASPSSSSRCNRPSVSRYIGDDIYTGLCREIYDSQPPCMSARVCESQYTHAWARVRVCERCLYPSGGRSSRVCLSPIGRLKYRGRCTRRAVSASAGRHAAATSSGWAYPSSCELIGAVASADAHTCLCFPAAIAAAVADRGVV